MNLIDFVKNNKYFLIAIFVILIIGLGLIFYLRWAFSKINFVSNFTLEETGESVGSVVSLEGSVEVSFDGASDWSKVEVNQLLYQGNFLRTARSSNTVLIIDQEIIVLGEESQIKIETANSSNISINQIYGKTYSVVEKKENQVFKVFKDSIEIAALGTEFLIDIPQAEQLLNTYVFKNKVSFKYPGNTFELEESNKTVLNLATMKHSNSQMNKNEKELNKLYLALIGKSAEIIAQKKQAAKAKAGQTASQSGTTSSGSSGAGSSGGSSGSGSPTPDIQGRYSSAGIDEIENSLQLVLTDSLNDYTNPGGGEPPGGVYPYPPIDTDKIYMGVRDGRLYIRWTLGGMIPTARETLNGNNILSVVYNIGIDNNNDHNAESPCAGREAHLQINIAYHDNGQIWYNPWFSAVCTGGGGGDQAEYAIYGNGLAHIKNGGIGKNAVIFSYNLSDLSGTVSIGSNLLLDISSEAEGSVYHHYSYDQNQISPGNPEWVAWTVAGI